MICFVAWIILWVVLTAIGMALAMKDADKRYEEYGWYEIDAMSAGEGAGAEGAVILVTLMFVMALLSAGIVWLLTVIGIFEPL